MATSRKHIITIAGRPGSGKSSTAKMVADTLDYEHFSSGDLFRALAEERGIDLMQANISAEENTEVDHLVDGRLREIGLESAPRVIDSRIAWHWMPRSFKVFLDLDLDLAARRIIKAIEQRKGVNESIPKEPHEYAKILSQRLDSENRRYKALYDIDPGNMSNYDLVVDTGENNLEEVVEIIVRLFTVWLEE